MPYDARAVANTILDLAEDEGLQLTHMAVHKIAFYAHAWRLTESGEPLIVQPFEAWQHGPVLRCVWDTLKAAGDKPVVTRAAKLDLVQGEWAVVPAISDQQDREFLRRMTRFYGTLHAFELSDMTHAKGGPWDLVYNEGRGRVNLGMKIENAAIQAHFRKVTSSGKAMV